MHCQSLFTPPVYSLFHYRSVIYINQYYILKIQYIIFHKLYQVTSLKLLKYCSYIVCHVNKKASDYVGKHQSQAFTFPIKSNEAIPNSVCLQCHSSNRVTSPTGDLKIPHDKHLNAGLLCVSCHFGVVHAKIAERDLSGVVDVNNFDAWNLDIAKKVATPAYIMPSMWTCIDCHKKANVTRQCGACHTTIPSLPSHDKPTWKSDHGQVARQDIGVCISCHATPDQPNFVSPSTGDKAADFARAQVFCYTCHLQRPQMHEKSMIPISSEVNC